MIRGQDNMQTCQFAEKTFRGQANKQTVDDSWKDVSWTSRTIHGQTV